MPRGEKYKFSTFFTQGQYETQVETLEVAGKNEGALIGVLKEDFNLENRVALVPNSIRTITGYGHRIVVESDAGKTLGIQTMITPMLEQKLPNLKSKCSNVKSLSNHHL